jgi:hypothetical protein
MKKDSFKERLIEGATYRFREWDFVATFAPWWSNQRRLATGWILTTTGSPGRGAQDDTPFMSLDRDGRLMLFDWETHVWTPTGGHFGQLQLVSMRPRLWVFGSLANGRAYGLDGKRYVARFTRCTCDNPNCEAIPWFLEGDDGEVLSVSSDGGLCRPNNTTRVIDGETCHEWRDTGFNVFDLEPLAA